MVLIIYLDKMENSNLDRTDIGLPNLGHSRYVHVAIPRGGILFCDIEVKRYGIEYDRYLDYQKLEGVMSHYEIMCSVREEFDFEVKEDFLGEELVYRLGKLTKRIPRYEVLIHNPYISEYNAFMHLLRRYIELVGVKPPIMRKEMLFYNIYPKFKRSGLLTMSNKVLEEKRKVFWSLDWLKDSGEEVSDELKKYVSDYKEFITKP